MKIVKPAYEVMFREERMDIYRKLERIGRTCYKSEDKITDDSCVAFVKMLMNRRHYAILEHVHVTVKWIIDRGVSHMLVRHRIGAFAQESTIYCDYTKDKFDGEIAVIVPDGVDCDETRARYDAWKLSCDEAEYAYKRLRSLGVHQSEARAVLPTCLKTELVTTFNLHQWRHVFEMRADPAEIQPLARGMAEIVLADFKKWLPEVFGDVIPWSKQNITRKGE